jgi:hypothetical protein
MAAQLTHTSTAAQTLLELHSSEYGIKYDPDALPTTLLIEACVVSQDSPTTTRLLAAVDAARVQATPPEALVWLQFVLEPGTKAMAPHAGAEQRKARTTIKCLVKINTPRNGPRWTLCVPAVAGVHSGLLFSWNLQPYPSKSWHDDCHRPASRSGLSSSYILTHTQDSL